MLEIIARYNKDNNSSYYFGLLFGLALADPKYRQSLQRRIKPINFQKTIIDSIRNKYDLILSSIYYYYYYFNRSKSR